jgi:universal stress protein F
MQAVAVRPSLKGSNWEVTMYKHILVAVDFDEAHDPEPSLRVARILADKDARVSILHVQEEVPSYVLSYMPPDIEDNLKAEFKARLDGLAAKIEGGQGVLVWGHSGRTILDWAEANAVDCIVIASHRPGLQDYLLGSTAGRVVRHARCAVHVMR